MRGLNLFFLICFVYQLLLQMFLSLKLNYIVMKKLYILAHSVCLSLLFFSCDDSELVPPVAPSAAPNSIARFEHMGKTIPLFFRDDKRGESAYYEAVKIGEYLWMTRNINHFTETPVTREQLDLVLTRYRLDAKNFQVSVEDFNKYSGQYYSVDYIYYHLRDENHGFVYEGEDRKMLLDPKTNSPEWKLANKADFRQLFGMCGNGSEYDVRTTLVCRPYENPAALPISYWISDLNTNKYGFNAMPTGARHHAPSQWSTHFGDGAPDPIFQNQKGDFYISFMAAAWAAADGTVRIHDYPDTQEGYLYHLQNIRFCRRLTDSELGYKLYIKAAVPTWADIANEYQSKGDDYTAELVLFDKLNQNIIQADKVDIQKVALGASIPSGYVELRKGYIRGFYVQYILDVAQPSKNVAQIMDMAKGLK
jgi:uncharacterized protein (TIGR02145 family)